MHTQPKYIIESIKAALNSLRGTEVARDFMNRFEVNGETLASGLLADVVCELYDDVLYKKDSVAASIIFNSLTEMAHTFEDDPETAELFVSGSLAELDYYETRFLTISY